VKQSYDTKLNTYSEIEDVEPPSRSLGIFFRDPFYSEIEDVEHPSRSLGIFFRDPFTLEG
jgi:hypothetical protein